MNWFWLEKKTEWFETIRQSETKMSRKSLPKKDSTVWYQCNNCNWHIFAKDRDQHSCTEQSIDEKTQKSYTFVANRKLSTNQLSEKSITDDVRTINANKLNNLIFLHESIFPLCQIVLGDYVLVSSSDLIKSSPIVRNAWPMSNLNSGLVCVSAEGCLTIKINNFQIIFRRIINSTQPFSHFKFQN